MQRLIALTDNNSLVSLDPQDYSQVESTPVTGLEGTLLGIDTRPANGLLYGLTTANNLYTIDPSSGAATLVSTLSMPFGGGVVSGFDFNPVADRLRLVGDNDQNFRINVDTGEVIVDGTLAFGEGDGNAGVNPNVTAAAYTNSFAGTTSTALYNIDALLNTLVLQAPPNDGTLVTVGELGTDFGVVGGFDIFSTAEGENAAFAVSDGLLYSIDLNSGAATDLGSLNLETSGNLIGLAAVDAPPAPPTTPDFLTLTSNNTLLGFSAAAPNEVSTVEVTGVEGTLLGIDVRPANGLLYGLTTANNLYTIDPSSGAATLVSTLSLPFGGGVVSGFDFNPVADRLRLVGDNDQNFRINVDTGEVIVDGTLAFVEGDGNAGVNPNVTAAAYTNSFAGTTATTLYDIDALLNKLVLQNPPNDGGLVTIGELGVDFGVVGGFDIFSAAEGENAAFAVSDGLLYAIDLETGTATDLGTIGDGSNRDLLGFVALSNPLVGEPGEYPAPDYSMPDYSDDLLNLEPLTIGAIAEGIPGGQALVSNLGNLLTTLDIPSLELDSLASLGITLPEVASLDTLLPQIEISSIIDSLQAEIAAGLAV